MTAGTESGVDAEMVGDAGQIAIPLLMVLLTFLLLVLGFAVDLTNVWVHRQAAQAAADAACEAGAMDMNATTAGETYTSTTQGFTVGTNGDCTASSTATICWYANVNGYNGKGLGVPGTDDVSWTFPTLVSGVTAGPGTYPFLQVTIVERVATILMGLMNASNYVSMTTSSTCGITQANGNAPLVVLNPSIAGALNYSGGAYINILGGPQRGIVVNSPNSDAVKYGQNQGELNLSKGGPNYTGSDMALVGPEPEITGATYGYQGGTTGLWRTSVSPAVDPYGSVPAPASWKSVTPANGQSGTWVAYGTDACPDNSGNSGTKGHDCMEFSPGYYSNGIQNLGGITTYIFLPGVYYMNGNLSASASATLRVARPSNYVNTQGVMFYFLTGSMQISGCSGCTNSGVGTVASTYLTCDGSSPPSSIGLTTNLNGNVLYGMCTAGGTYYDGQGSSPGDTTDTLSSTGIRGLLVFSAHSNITSGTSETSGSTPCIDFAGSGQLQFAGTFYCHNTAYNSQLQVSGAGTTGTYMLGEMIADEVLLTGSGTLNLALNPNSTGPTNKVTVVQ